MNAQASVPKSKGSHRRLLRVIGGAIVAAILAGLLTPVREAFLQFVDPATQWVATSFRNWRDPLPPRQLSGDYVVLVADFDGDDSSRSQSRRIAEIIAANFPNPDGDAPIRVLRYPRVLALLADGDITTARAAAERTGRGWLAATDADLLVWGSVRHTNDELEVRYLRQRTSDEERFFLRDQTIRASLVERIAPVIALTFAMDTFSIYARGDEQNESVLQESADRLRPLVENPLSGFSPMYSAQIFNAYGLVVHELGRVQQSRPLIEESIRSYEDGLRMLPESNEEAPWPDLRAMIVNNRAMSISTLYSVTGDTALRSTVLETHRAALSTSRRGSINAQATAASNLAAILIDLDGNNAASLAEAHRLLAEAYQLYQSERANWNMARVALLIGDAWVATDRLRPSTDALMAALGTYQRAAAGLRSAGRQREFAEAQMKVGSACILVMSRTRRIEVSDVGFAAIAEAESIFRQRRDSGSWAMAQGNLGTLYVLAANTTDVAQMIPERRRLYEMAIRRFEAATTVWTVEAAPDWHANMLTNVATARASLARLEN